MDETLTAWVFLFIVFLIWALGSCFGPPKTFWTHWYAWLLILFGYLLARSWLDILLFDFVPIGFPLNAAIAKDHLTQVNTDLRGGMNETDIQRFYLGSHLSKITSMVPIASTVAFCVVAYQVFVLHHAGAAQREQGEDGLARTTSGSGTHTHWILAILIMPATLATMALRSWMRTVMLMTGSAYRSLSKPCPHDQSWGMGVIPTCGYSFDEVSELEFRTSETDLDVGSACQYFAVFCFALACIHYFPKYPDTQVTSDYIFALKTVGFLGLWIYVVMGATQSVANIILCFAANLNIDTMAAQGMKAAFAPLMSFCTVLCVLNMGPILKIRDLTEETHLGKNASVKFIGSRILLLAGTLLPKILTFILAPKDGPTGKSALQILLDKYIGQDKWPGSYTLAHAGQSEFQMQLWMSTLLCFICVLVAVANLCLWRKMPSGRVVVVPDTQPLAAPLLAA